MGTAIMMAGTSTGGTENGLAQIDSPMAGNLVGVDWAGYCDFDTDNDIGFFQLSFGSTNTVQNDSRQVISNFSFGALTFTAGGSVIGKADHYVPLPDIPIGMGERLWIHGINAAGVVANFRVMLYFDFDLDKVQVRRR